MTTETLKFIYESFGYTYAQGPIDMGAGDADEECPGLHTKFTLVLYNNVTAQWLGQVLGSDGMVIQFITFEGAVRYAAELMRRYPQYYVHIEHD